MTTSRIGSECGNISRVKLNHILAIIVRKEGCQGDPGDFWMYENGYLLFQGLLSSNSICWWNNGLNGATKSLIYYGYVNPGALLVGSEPCALEILRNAWARRVLQPPPGYQIVGLEDIEQCNALPVPQTQWTPLPEAVCAVVLRLSSQGRPAGIETIREALILAFPHVSPPSEQTLYDTLVQLTKERKLYNTSSGYFIVTPERKRSRSHSRTRPKRESENVPSELPTNKTMLMSTEEAMVMVHGDMATIRDGNVTHQCVQTNLADVICGGNASDKILYPRTKRRSASFPAHRSPDRRGSFRLWSSNRRLRRSASTRTIHKHYVDTSSSTEYPNSGDSTPTPKKESLLSRIFRRSKRSQCQIGTFGAQFPPSEWFNSKAVHLHSIGTQTASKKDSGIDISAYLETSDLSSRSATLPRNRHHHRRQLSSDATLPTVSRENSPVSNRFAHNTSSAYSTSTLPRKHGHRSSPRKSSKTSLTNNNRTSHETKAEVISQNGIDSSINTTTTPTATTTTISNGTKYNENGSLSYDEITSESPVSVSPIKHLSSIDNSGPSSIESHKSSKTGSSLSGPSSLESHKTVINRTTAHESPPSRSVDSRSLKKQHGIKRDAMKTNKLPPSSSSSSSSSSSPAAAVGTTTTAAAGTVKTSTMNHSNSFTLQVTTNQNGVSIGGNSMATINTGNPGGSNTKIFVQNSPVRSVITFENGQSDGKNPNVVVINGDSIQKEGQKNNTKNTNQEAKMKVKDDGLQTNGTTMNNSRKLSLQLPPKDSINFPNLIKNVSSNTCNQYISNSNPDSPILASNSLRTFSAKNALYNSNPPSPTKSYEALEIGKYFNKNDVGSKTSLEKFTDNKVILEKNNCIGSEPNIVCLSRENSKQQFPSLSDLSFNFTSLAAQKILKGVSINSVDTLVELNMAANNNNNNMEKQNNCEMVHTDFGLV